MEQERFNRAVETVGRIVAYFILLEIALFPLRAYILSLYRLLFPYANVVWECTAVDETLLLLAAVVAYPAPRACKYRWCILGILLVQLYNVLRVFVLSYYPDPLLHELLFRVGGFFVVLAAFYLVTRRCPV